LISSAPLEHPYPSVEPKSAKARAHVGEPSLRDLLLQRHLQIALDGVKKSYQGPWYLPRVVGTLAHPKTRQKRELPEDEDQSLSLRIVAKYESETVLDVAPSGLIFHHNPDPFSTYASIQGGLKVVRIPPSSTILQGDIEVARDILGESAPIFDLVILDPPWPNRSARRKHSYAISYGRDEIRALLSSIPIRDHVAEDGCLCVWVTNKPAYYDMLLKEGGLLEEWGAIVVEEWVWLKVTAAGDPICGLDSTWRKPYEVLIVARKGQSTTKKDVKRRVIIGVPDLHSRKPNLKCLFDQLMEKPKYPAVEIFARNLTSGWWSWGNETLRFQTAEYWTTEIDR